MHGSHLHVASVYDFARAIFTAATLAGDTQLKLDSIKTFAFKGEMGNGFIGYVLADANNHGQISWLEMKV
jgi:hypothetical protein